MVTQVSQLPSEVNLFFVRGDDFAVPVTFTGANITSRTFSAYVFADLTGEVAFTAAVQPVNASAGSMKVVFARASTSSLPVSGNFRWCLQETTGGLVVTKLSGRLAARLP
jgi:hypothetical protein